MEVFVYKWTQITSVFAIKGCQYIENGIIKQEDLMQTVWTPLNFECPPVNFLLRKNHEHEVHMIGTFFNLVKKDWLKTLKLTDYEWVETGFDDDTKTQSCIIATIENKHHTSSKIFVNSTSENDNKGVFQL
jgi:hypothetical protein|tara:strand:+ start:300 stop:692 length:393 start_codon:yes stop_codon:yes gene_type:complete